MEENIFDSKIEGNFDFDRFFKLTHTIKIKAKPQELAASANIEESNSNGIKGAVNLNDELFSIGDYSLEKELGKQPNETAYQAGKKFESFIEELINVAGIRNYTKPDPPDFLIANNFQVSLFNTTFKIKVRPMPKQVYVEAKNYRSNQVFFSQKNFGKVDTMARLMFARVLQEKRNLVLAQQEGKKLLRDFVFKGDVYTGEVEYVLFKYDTEKNIQVYLFDREEFLRSLGSSTFSVSPSKGGASVVLSMNGKSLVRFEARSGFKENLSKDTLIRERDHFKAFAERVFDLAKFSFSGEAEHETFYNFLKDSKIPEAQIAQIRGWLKGFPAVEIDRNKKVGNELSITVRCKQIPLSGNKFTINVKINDGAENANIKPTDKK